MSKSLHAKIKAEICRREEEKLRKQMEKEKVLKEKILQSFECCLDKCLQNFEDYTGHSIGHITDYDHVSSDLLKELGFDFVAKTSLVSVPPFEKGYRRTPAQLKLFEFEQKLRKARKEKKEELLAECKRVKQCLEEGDFQHFLAYKDLPSRVWVESCQRFSTKFEEDVISTFFAKFQLTFNGFHEEYLSGTFWTFSL